MLTLITGGSGSGKSAFAEQYVQTIAQGRRVYIATMADYGEESRKKIDRHHRMRAGKGFLTLEQPHSLEQISNQIGLEDTLLLEDLPNLLANHIWMLQDPQPVSAILNGLQQLEAGCRHLVVVTGELFGDGVRYLDDTGRYLCLMGQLHQILAQRAQRVVEVVYTIPIYHKGAQPQPTAAKPKKETV